MGCSGSKTSQEPPEKTGASFIKRLVRKSPQRSPTRWMMKINPHGRWSECFGTGCLGTNGPSPGGLGHLPACPPACLSTPTTVSVHRSMRTTGSWGSFFFPPASQLYFFFNKQSDHRVLSFTTLGNFLSTSLMRVISQLGLTIGYVFTVTPWRPECGWFFITVDSVPSSASK